jgi:tetratricopeptide (TPR) repeat protein
MEHRQDHLDAMLDQARALHAAGRLQEAEQLYLRVHEQAYRLQDTSHWLGVLSLQRGNFGEATRLFEQSLKIDPNQPAVLSNLSVLLHQQGRVDDALKASEAALRLDPNFADAHRNRGCSLVKSFRFEEALESFLAAYALEPRNVEGINNVALTLRELNRIEEALTWYARALALEPKHPQSNFGESVCRLLLGDFENGLPKYEWRFAASAGRLKPRDFAAPRWDGQETLVGKTVLLYAEQGYGDTIQFCRYAKKVADLGAKVVLEVPSALKPLLKNLDGVAEITVQGDPLPPVDFQSPLLSLPLAFKMSMESIPADTPYLQPDPTLVAKLKLELSVHRRPKIGLCWKGGAGFAADFMRSPGLAVIEPLVQQIDACFFTLVQNSRKEFLALGSNAIDLGREVDADTAPFAETAALIQNLDLVITCDTSIAHLAGALGKSTWIMLQYASDWRWFSSGSISPWYPTVRLFRQPSPGDWRSVVSAVQSELRMLSKDWMSE